MKRICSVTVKDKNGHPYSYETLLDTKYLPGLKDAGIDIYELENTIPVWINNLGLTKPWVFIQDLLNFKNPLKGLN
jgi:hypothetical protein